MKKLQSWICTNRLVLKSRIIKLVTASLITPLIAIIAPPQVIMQGAHAAATNYTLRGITCDTSGDDSIYVTPSHGQAFYVDGTNATAANDLDASYIGYQIQLKSGAPKTNVWVEISNFNSATTSYTTTAPTISAVAGSTDKLQIANSIDSLTTSDTRTAFFLLKATNINTWGNASEATGTYTHTVTVYDGKPGFGGTPLRTCTYTFTKVFNTTAAAANKVTSITLSKSQPLLGETVTVTVAGQTGTIGSGTKSPDANIVWLSAAPYSSFPISALRLTQTSYQASGTCSTPKINQLLMLNASSSGGGECDGNYTAKYTFTVIGSGSATQVVAPIAQISSGTEIKHTSLTSKTIDLSKATTAGLTFQKGFMSAGPYDSITVGGTDYLHVQYVETVTVNSGSVTIDYISDSATAGTIMETSTAYGKIAPTYQFGNSGTPVTILPTYSGGINFFQGPFNFTSTSPLVLKYWMLVPSASGTYENTASAYIGDKQITASGGLSVNTIISNGSKSPTTSSSVKISPPAVTTSPATSVTDTTAILHGSLDQRSDTTTLYFDWGTNETLTSYTRVNVGESTTTVSDTSTTLSGLTTGTTYYFRIVGVGYTGLSDTGTILSFVAQQTLVTTTNATDVTFTKATLNGQFQTTLAATLTYKMFWGTTNSISASTLDSQTIGSIQKTDNVIYDTSTVITGLSANTTYYYRIIAFNGATQVAQGDVVPFVTGGVTTSAASSLTGNSATLNGTFNFGDDSATAITVGFIYGTSSNLISDSTTVSAAESPAYGDLSSITKALTGLTAGTYYFQAYAFDGLETTTAEIKSFTLSSGGAAPAPQLIPLITWPTPATITYPTPLSGTQLNAVATYNGVQVPGTYTYRYPLGTILQPGTYPMTVTFTPTSSTYAPVSTLVYITVIAPTVNITWPTPPSVQGPVTLSPTQLNATCSVPGTLTYDPALGTVLQPGTYTLRVTCRPTDPTLPPVSTTVPFIVLNRTPTITWANPAPLTAPVRLTNTQLNATCSEAGTLTYDPALGTTYTAPGTYTLKVTCTPNDKNLAPVTTTVQLIILAPSVLAPVRDAKTGPITFTQGQVSWTAATGAIKYVVDIRGKVLCETSATSCKLAATVGPKTPVIVTAVNAKGDKASARATYFNDKLLTAIVVNFATGSYLLDAKANKEISRVSAIVKREGFTYVEITGHTDPRGGALNVALSDNRSKALKAAMAKLNPSLKFKNGGFSYENPVASNKTKSGMASNRRSEGAVK